jgi:hypothetical protein
MNTATATAATAAASVLLEVHKDWHYFTPQHHQGIAARLALEKKVHPHTVSTLAYNMSMDGTWPSMTSDSAGYSEAYEGLLREVVDAYCKADAEHRAFMRQIEARDRRLVRKQKRQFDEPESVQQKDAKKCFNIKLKHASVPCSFLSAADASCPR